MKIRHVTMEIEEHDFELYEEELVRRGWVKEKDRYAFRKNFGDLQVVMEEKLPMFGTSVTFKISAGDEKSGFSGELLIELLHELIAADQTPDHE